MNLMDKLKIYLVGLLFACVFYSCSPSESPSEKTVASPLLDLEDGFVQYDKIMGLDTAAIDEALEFALEQAKDEEETLLASDAYGFDDFFNLTIGELLDRAWSAINLLKAVQSTPVLRSAIEKWNPAINEFYISAYQDERLFQKLEKLLNSEEYKRLGPTEQHLVQRSYDNLVLSGARLDPSTKERLKEIGKKLSSLSDQFSNNVVDSRDSYEMIITDEKKLAGLPEDAVKAARELAKSKGKDKGGAAWLFNLQYASYRNIAKYADERGLREEIYRAFISQASDQASYSDIDNAPVIREILTLRGEKAQILDFNNFAELSLQTKIAESPEQILEFLEDLHETVWGPAEEEYAELAAFAQERDGIEELQPWDVSYYANKLKEASYNVSSEQIKQYLPEGKVLAGFWRLVDQLFGVTFKEFPAPVWNEAVKYYKVYRNGEEIAGIYMDLYARDGKRGGAWQSTELVREKLPDASIRLPRVHVVANFSPPDSAGVNLLTLSEVETFFHELGHALHSMLSEQIYSGASMSNVEWDAIEAPAMLLEKWVYEPEVIQNYITAHYETGEPMPVELLDKIVAAKNFGSARSLEAQLEFSLLDMNLHYDFDVESQDLAEYTLALFRSLSPLPVVDEYRMENRFGHIFAGGYAAGYYGYMWSDVMSSDMFMAKFKENGIFDSATAQDYVDKILAKGSARDFMDLYRDFMGREPQGEYLLLYNGIDIDKE